MKEYQVKTIFVEPKVSKKIAEVIAQATGTKIETLSPLEADPKNKKDMIENLDDNLETLYKALKQEK